MIKIPQKDRLIKSLKENTSQFLTDYAQTSAIGIVLVIRVQTHSYTTRVLIIMFE